MSKLLGKTVVITLKRSTISTIPKHRAFIQTLGLRNVGDTCECVYTPNVHGIAKRIPYLIGVKEKG
ncbi:MAG: 50S ribosomal protein L30 [Holophagales bacterium]|jgi:large subunit ribosomal protein L30|nr:50S ribosomal protein L30 [Holophagales bacterium]